VTEINRILRVNVDPSKNPEGFRNQLNQKLGYIADILDGLNGHRGTPTFYSDLDVNEQKLTNVADAVEETDAPNLAQITALVGALGITTGSATVKGASKVIDEIPIADGRGSLWCYTAVYTAGSTQNMRTGIIISAWDTNGVIEKTEFRTESGDNSNLGNTRDMTLAVVLATYEGGKEIELQSTSTNEYTIYFWRALVNG
jgi:hypothetical protein